MHFKIFCGSFLLSDLRFLISCHMIFDHTIVWLGIKNALFDLMLEFCLVIYSYIYFCIYYFIVIVVHCLFIFCSLSLHICPTDFKHTHTSWEEWYQTLDTQFSFCMVVLHISMSLDLVGSHESSLFSTTMPLHINGNSTCTTH